MSPPYVTNVRCVMIDFNTGQRIDGGADDMMLTVVPRVGEWVSYKGRAFEVVQVRHVATRGSMRVNDRPVYLVVNEAHFVEVAELS